MHPSIHFFVRSKEQVKQLIEEMADELEELECEFHVLSWGEIDHRRYYIMRDRSEDAVGYSIYFNKEEHMSVDLEISSNHFKFESNFESSVLEKYHNPMLTALTEFIIVEAAIQNVAILHGSFYDYDGFPEATEISRLVLAIMQKLKFDTVDSNPGFKVSKVLKGALSPVEKALKKSGINDLKPARFHHGKLANKKYYFTAVFHNDGLRYDLRSYSGSVVVEVKTVVSSAEVKITINVASIYTRDHTLFQKILENICFDCIHNNIPGDIKAIDCAVDKSLVALIEPGFNYFYATQIDNGDSLLFSLPLQTNSA